MSQLDAYAALTALNAPVIATRDATAALRMAPQNAVRLLRELERAGLASRLRHGLWLLDLGLDPQTLPPYLTAPYPAYVSLWSALHIHGMIEQIPRRVYVVSLARTQTLVTTRGEFEIHHLPPNLFGGFVERGPDRYVATPEKALFDSAYLRAVRRAPLRTPELTIPAGFKAQMLDGWLASVASPAVRTLTRLALEKTLASAAAQPDA